MKLPTLLLMTLCSCAASPQAGPAPFSPHASQVVMSLGGALRVEVFEQVDRPVVRGVNAVRLAVSASEAGLDLRGLRVTVTPWMPVMGHGSAVVPTVTPDEAGFIVDDLTLPMAGLWELRCTFEGPVSDHAIVRFDLE